MASPVIEAQKLDFPWPCLDPFLFCAYHNDQFPAGRADLGPAVSLEGRELGQDFAFKDGWNMYHGRVVPGFPQHPHRGFETITIVRQGLVDHFDSLGGAARYGEGDTQWLTTGAGISHSEMFPLLKRDQGNPADLFQIWLNLPAAKKMAPPAFSMLWDKQQPRIAGNKSELKLVAGGLAGKAAAAPPKDSYASQAGSDILIAVLTARAGGSFKLPAGPEGVNRCLYLYKGAWTVDGEEYGAGQRLQVRPDAALELASAGGGELLILQGRPMDEPVVSYGPFVMNDRQQLMQAFEDYQRTHFGGWPWESDDPAHPAEQGRFARFPDGREERP
ncbi:MAG TPA: pirin family protein [bacterium]|nr:pirin family protein [bacterium]